MKKVFINYSWDHDKASADYIYDKLTSAKVFDVWRDKENLLGGIEWRRTLRDTIREVDYFVCILSSKSISGRGVRNVEIRVALDVLDEFPPGEVYLIPTRVDNCTPKFSELTALNYVDLFPEKEAGLQKLLIALGVPPTASVESTAAPMPAAAAPPPSGGATAGSLLSSVTRAPKPRSAAIHKNFAAVEQINAVPARTAKKKAPTPMHSYTVGLIDIDMEMADLEKFTNKLNKAQNFFLFKNPVMPDISNCTRVFGGIKNFAVFKLPKSYISNNPQLASDLVACITKLPLAFDEGDHFAYNYFAGPSEQDNRFLFLSADHLAEYCKQAGCSFKQGLVSILVGQLISYFTKIGYHPETRGCVMDFCENRADIAKSLKTRKLCKQCSAKLPEGKLRDALMQLLALKI